MRGIPISTKLQKADAVILAAHWDRENGDLKALRMVERRGKVWGNSISRAPDIVAAGIPGGKPGVHCRKRFNYLVIFD